MKRLGRWHIDTSRDGQYYAVLKSSNGKVLVTTETEKSRRNVRRTIAAAQRHAPGDMQDNTR